MKRLNKNILLVFSLLLAAFFQVQAMEKSPVAVVSALKGEAFVSYEGKTKPLRPGHHLYDFAEVTTTMGAQITFNDYHDHKYHLSGGGHLLIMNRVIELKQGYVWIQSSQQGEQVFSIQTANAKLDYSKGEGIVSFDPVTGKTQFMSISGKFSFSNILNEHYVTEVDSSEFSYVDVNYENGMPRKPTPIGKSTFKKVTSLFPNVSSDKEMGQSFPFSPTPGKKESGRSIASVENMVPTMVETQPAGGYRSAPIVVVESHKEELKKKDELLKFYQEKVMAMEAKMKPKPKPKFAPSYAKKSGVKVRVYGKGASHSTSVADRVKKSLNSNHRRPASFHSGEHHGIKKTWKMDQPVVKRAPASPVPIPQVDKGNPFENSLVEQYKKQMRHSDEVNQLIQDLKNYDQDYKTSY